MSLIVNYRREMFYSSRAWLSSILTLFSITCTYPYAPGWYMYVQDAHHCLFGIFIFVFV